MKLAILFGIIVFLIGSLPYPTYAQFDVADFPINSDPAFQRGNQRVSTKSVEPMPYNAATIQGSGCRQVNASNDNSIGEYVMIAADEKLVRPQDVIASASSYFACAKIAYERLLQGGQTAVDPLQKVVIGALLYAITFLTNIGIVLLQLASYLLVLMIGQGSFIQNELVRQAWPFVQGIANLGFIFALLYIALATTLRLESVSSSVQRLLPKLLIGALLVNFSLVIGGLLIDASRLMMAVEINILGQGQGAQGVSRVTRENLGLGLLRQSGIYENVFKKSTGVSYLPDGLVTISKTGGWSLVIQAVQAMIFTAAVASGMVVVSLGLFWRYIVLLILLIISPLAYVAIALPQTIGYARKWWSYFIQWVVYGPIVLFVLILITKVQASSIVQQSRTQGNGALYQSIIQLIIVVALLYVAASVGKKASGVGADAFMGFMKKTGRAAIRNPKTTLALGGLIASGGTGAALLGGAAALGVAQSKSAKDFYKGVGTNLKQSKVIKPIRDTLGIGTRDKEGNLLPGKDSIGATLAGKLTDKYNTRKQGEINATKAMLAPGTNSLLPGSTTNSALSPSQLKKEHVIMALGNNETERSANVKVIIENGTQAQRKAVAQNKDYIASLNPTQLSELQRTIQSAVGPNGQPLSDKDKTDTIEQVLKTVDDLNKK